MKIIRLSTFLDYGGIETKMANLSSYHDLNNDWIFCAIGKGGLAEEKIRKNNKKVICFNLPHKIPNFKTIYSLYKFFSYEKPDVVHTSGAEANFHGVIAAKLARVRIVISEEIGIPKHSKGAKLFFRFIYNISNYVLGESRVVIDHLSKNYKLNRIKLKAVSNFFLFSDLNAYEIERDPTIFNISSVSRLDPIKNIESIIRVISKLKNESINVIYTIVGDGPYQERLKELVKELVLEDNVIFVGFLHDPYLILLQSHLYILTSFSEGFSNSLVEAMYSGTPALSTRVGAAEELIQDNINGWLIEPNDDNELLMKIKRIIKMKPIERAAIGMKGKKTIIKNYSLQNHISLLMDCYKRSD